MSDKIPMTTFKEEHLVKGCKVCGAFSGSRCRNKNGVALVKVHAARVPISKYYQGNKIGISRWA